MKKLFIIRHAKSSWDSRVKSDFDRPLNKRGLRDAPMMGKILKKANIVPDLILASSAKRAKKTAIFISNEIGYKENDIIFDEDLYLSSVDELIDIISEVDSDINTLFLIAHNPGLTNFVNSFCKDKISNLPTTGIFSMEFDILSWNAISTQSAKKCFFDYPKRYQL